MKFLREVMLVLMSPEGDGGAGGGAAAVETGGGASSGSASSGSTSTGTATLPPSIKWEDTPQYKGQLADLQKERKQRQAYEQQVRDAQTRLTERERQIAALTGAQTPSKDQAEEQAVRDRFKQLYPHLADLTAEDVQAIREAKQLGSQYQASEEGRWTNHHTTMIAEVHSGIAKELGDLTPRQITRINAAYVRECEANPEFMQRIERGDKTATAQFVSEYLEDFVGPIKRREAANNVNRFRTVPNGKDRSVPVTGGKAIDPTDEKAVSEMLGAHFKRNR